MLWIKDGRLLFSLVLQALTSDRKPVDIDACVFFGGFGMYSKCFKRIIDFAVSLCAFIVLLPVMMILAVIGAIAMGGNPFFVQPRPGKKDKHGKEKIFYLIKFRTMSNKKDANGDLLPDDVRLNKYGKFLRSTSLDELPELLNILKGDMSIVGPRPLLVEYLPYYTEEERRRHDIRPGLTGWAQVNGRNNIRRWEDRFRYDIEYVDKCTLWFDIKILVLTVKKVLNRSDVLVGSEIKAGRLDNVRKVEKKDADINQKV